ncbi:MAG: TauD/TfdA family dioxygenase, partial [Rhodospirillales bacterium]
MTFRITPLSDALGSEVVGVDFSKPVSVSDFQRIQSELTDRLVLVVRDQNLTPAQLVATVQMFGEIMPQHLSEMLMPEHPDIAVLDSRNVQPGPDGRIMPVGSRAWHTDHTNHAMPPKFTVLYAVSLPQTGGDTSFANMQRAYARLTDNERKELVNLRTLNKIEDHSYVSDADRSRFGERQSHPLIRTHPDTGRKGIYLHPGKTESIEGMTPEDSRVFVDQLLDKTIGPEVIYRHHWLTGDLIIWDNRGVSHRAHADYDLSAGRVMHRVLV